jgi:hypothetical protein
LLEHGGRVDRRVELVPVPAGIREEPASQLVGVLAVRLSDKERAAVGEPGEWVGSLFDRQAAQPII